MGIGCHAVWTFLSEYVFQEIVLFINNEKFDDYKFTMFHFAIVKKITDLHC